ncbi:hypothetical protein MMC07_001499 [Pseudocyphellaria aurata]|nr:hypothetical protein [Pseudocyphellaria aurata]
MYSTQAYNYDGVTAASTARSPGTSTTPEGVVAADAARSPGVLIVPEGVGAADAAQSPGTSATTRAQAALPARRLPIPKDLVIDMVDDLVASEATGRGKRIRKPRKIFEEAAEPRKGNGQRKREKDPTATIALPPLKNRVVIREVSAAWLCWPFCVAAAPSSSGKQTKAGHRQ